MTETLITGWEKTPTDVEYITLSTMGTDTTILKEFVDAAIVHNMAKDQDTIGIYELHNDTIEKFNGLYERPPIV